jgi:eukaryotic-like serine/threonine-protein kinase
MSQDLDKVKVDCPGCSEKLFISRKYSLKKYKCTECEASFYVPELFSNYLLMDIISNDETTSSHHCQDNNTGHVSVLRRLNADLRHDAAICRVFLDEAEKLEKMSSDSVVKVALLGEFDGVPYVVFEHFGKISLKKKLRDDSLSVEESCFLFLDILGAMESSFDQSLVHGNLKPSNIRYDEHGNTRLLDFGMSAALTKELMKSQPDINFYNNPYYMAPETVSHGELTPSSDTYALGALLYEMLSGKKPFEKESSFDAMTKKQTEKPEPPNHLRPGIPPVLNNLVMTMLEIDSAKRPQFMVQVIAVLQNICESKPKISESVITDKVVLDDSYVEAGALPEELLKSLTPIVPEEAKKSFMAEYSTHIVLVVVLLALVVVLAILSFR